MMAIHLGWLLPATSSNLPGHRYRIAPVAKGNACPYMVLLRMGFTMPVPLPVRRCALTAPFHPCRRSVAGAGGLFSVALSLGSPPPGVTRHPDPVEPGLSSPFDDTKAAAIRSSDRGGLYAGNTSVVKQAPWPAFRGFRSWQSLRLFQRRSTRRLPFRLCRFARPPVDQPNW